MQSRSVRDRLGISQILFVVAIIAFISLFADQRPTPFTSAEVQFSDQSIGGLKIVPASCPSDPHAAYECTCPTAIEGGWDASGRILYANYTGRMINVAGVFKCVSNNTANVFFVPVGSNAEAQSFINAAPGIGVTVFEP